MAKPSTVDEYIASFPEPARGTLHELRELSLTAVPQATEGLKWGQPAYSVGTIMFVFSGHKNHASFVVTPSTLEAFRDQLDGFVTGKGSIQLRYGEPVPADLLRAMIAHRVAEFEGDGVLWR